jgi:hypothetical protein
MLYTLDNDLPMGLDYFSQSVRTIKAAIEHLEATSFGRKNK